MTRKTIILIIAGLLACGGFSSAVYEHHEAGRSRAARSASNQQRTELQQQLRLTKIQIENAKRDALVAGKKLEEIKPRLKELIAQRKAALAAELAANPTKLHILGHYALLDESPEFQRLYREWRQASYGLEYQHLARYLKLTPEQTTAVGRIYDEYVQSHADMVVALKQQGFSENDPNAKKLFEESNDEVCAKFREVLGENGPKTFNLFKREQLSPARIVADSVAMNLYYSDTPLSISYTNKLTKLIKECTQNVQGSGQIDWNAVQSKAATFMSAPQIDALVQQRDYSQLKTKVNEIYKNAIEVK